MSHQIAQFQINNAVAVHGPCQLGYFFNPAVAQNKPLFIVQHFKFNSIAVPHIVWFELGPHSHIAFLDLQFVAFAKTCLVSFFLVRTDDWKVVSMDDIDVFMVTRTIGIAVPVAHSFF